jgi:hypothetical protein
MEVIVKAFVRLLDLPQTILVIDEESIVHKRLVSSPPNRETANHEEHSSGTQKHHRSRMTSQYTYPSLVRSAGNTVSLTKGFALRRNMAEVEVEVEA